MNRKYIQYLFVIISLFFIGLIPVSAKENCTSVKSEMDKYDSYVKLLNSIDCTDNSDETNVATCNEFNVRKNLIVKDLMKKDEEKSICSNEKKQVNQIIKENKDNCGQIFDDSFNNFVNKLMLIFYIAGPILLILFGSLDFAKATVSSEADALKKASTRFAKRLAATILLFLAPALVNIVISFNVSDKYLSGNAYACNYKYLVYNKTYNIKYVPRSNSSTSSSQITANGNILETAELVHEKHHNEKWVWSITNNLINNDIVAQSNNPNKTTCCAGYVAEVLYRAGIFSESIINKYSYHSANTGIAALLSANGWKEITNYDSMQPGDIAIYAAHVQIYAGVDKNGNKVFFSEGSTAAIQNKEQPYTAVDRSSFKHAYRMP